MRGSSDRYAAMTVTDTRPANWADMAAIDGEPSSLVNYANKLCAHAATHQCRFLASSDSALCSHCAYAVSNGQPCV